MKTQELKEIVKQLPTGSMRVIATRSRCNYSDVQRVLSGKKSKHEIKIISTLANYLKEYKEDKAFALKELQAVAGA